MQTLLIQCTLKRKAALVGKIIVSAKENNVNIKKNNMKEKIKKAITKWKGFTKTKKLLIISAVVFLICIIASI